MQRIACHKQVKNCSKTAQLMCDVRCVMYEITSSYRTSNIPHLSFLPATTYRQFFPRLSLPGGDKY